jgi:hypothetical protein
MYTVDIREDSPCRTLHLGIQVNRIYDADVRELFDYIEQGEAYFFQVLSERLPAMTGHENGAIVVEIDALQRCAQA